jgi:hypothetical protein
MNNTLTVIGSLFSLAVFWHFVADWFPQSHQEALAKSQNADTRAWHCSKYTLVMMAPLIGTNLITRPYVAFACAMILYVSHYIIDSYVPVLLWAKYLRKHPAFDNVMSDKDAFKAMASTNIGLILIITMDQLFHIAFLLPVITLAVLYGF